MFNIRILILLSPILCQIGIGGQLSITTDICATIGNTFRLRAVFADQCIFIQWQRNDTTNRIFLSSPANEDCGVTTNNYYNLKRYDFTCHHIQNVYTLDIKKIINDDLGFSWRGICQGSSTTYTESLPIRLCVSVKSVNVTAPSENRVDVTEGVSEAFMCETSASMPQANVTWYKKGYGSDEETMTGSITTNTTETSDNLIITRSYLYYIPTKDDQNYTIYCKANNSDAQPITSAHQPQINVLHAPDDQPIIQDHGDFYTLMENSTLNFTCVIHGGNPRPILTWICNEGIITVENVAAETKVRVVWRAERNKDGPCTCISYHPLVSTNQSDTVNIEILYPPTKPALSIEGVNRTGTLTVINSTDVTLHCLSSSKPPPEYTWQYQNNQQSGDSISIPIQQNTSVRCIVSNTMEVELGISTISSDVFFHILHGPTIPKLSCSSQPLHSDINRATVNYIDGDNPTLTCSADGDPEPSYTWNGQSGGTLTISNAEHNNMVYNCTASSFIEPDIGDHKRFNASSFIQVNQLYGPKTSPELTYTYVSGASGTLSTPFNVVENSSFSITCDDSNSRPLSKYHWIGQFESDSGVLDVTAIIRSPQVDINGTSYYECTCMVQNTMVNTCGDQRTEIGTRNRTQRVNVLFSASLDAVPDRSVLEGNIFNLSAPVKYRGSPRETFKWFYSPIEGINKTELANDSSLTLKNISRMSAGFYTIEATNQISPTGLQTYTVIVNQTFYLNVFYKTSISTFKIDGQEGNITVNESSPVSLLCYVESNPASNIHLHAITYTGENSLAQSTLTYRLEYMLQTATCYDTGVYVCNGKNNYTSIQAVERSYLFVRCTPRPRYPVNKNITLYGALGESVTLNMTVIAYPIPSPGQFTWVKINGQNETVIITEPNTNITTADLDTQLTIKHLNQTNLGQYKLTIQYSDTGDSYIHYFYIAPKDKPQRPTQFIFIEERLTETTAYFEWTPGFDGGLPQTFYILYRTHGDSIWSHTSVAGSNTTLTELIPNTLYYVKLYANNKLGNSSETTVLNITTKERTDVLTPSDSASATIGGVVGGVSALIIIVVVVVVFIRQRKGGNDSEEHVYETPQCSTMSSEKDNAYNTLHTVGQIHSDPNTYYNLESRNPYEDLKREHEDNHEYGNLNISHDTEINEKLSDDKMYENLRLSPMKLE